MIKLIYCIESPTNQVDTQLIDWLRRSSFNQLGNYKYLIHKINIQLIYQKIINFSLR